MKILPYQTKTYLGPCRFKSLSSSKEGRDATEEKKLQGDNFKKKRTGGTPKPPEKSPKEIEKAIKEFLGDEKEHIIGTVREAMQKLIYLAREKALAERFWRNNALMRKEIEQEFLEKIQEGLNISPEGIIRGFINYKIPCRRPFLSHPSDPPPPYVEEMLAALRLFAKEQEYRVGNYLYFSLGECFSIPIVKGETPTNPQITSKDFKVEPFSSTSEFSTIKPDPLMFGQKDLGICYFLSPIAALWENPAGRKWITSLIEDTKDGCFKVKIPAYPEPILLTYEDMLNSMLDPVGFQNLGSDKKAIDTLRVILWAYGEMRARNGYSWKERGYIGSSEKRMPHFTVKDHLNYGGKGLYELTGWKIAHFDSDGKPEGDINWQEEELYALTQSFNEHGNSFEAEKLLDKIGHNPGRFVVTVDTPKRKDSESFIYNSRKYMDKEYRFVCNHCYYIRRVDPEKKRVTVINPWDTRKEQLISYDEFFKYFAVISGVKVPDELIKK